MTNLKEEEQVPPANCWLVQYIESNFQKIGLEPKGTNGFIQEFEVDEGKKFGR